MKILDWIKPKSSFFHIVTFRIWEELGSPVKDEAGCQYVIRKGIWEDTDALNFKDELGDYIACLHDYGKEAI